MTMKKALPTSRFSLEKDDSAKATAAAVVSNILKATVIFG